MNVDQLRLLPYTDYALSIRAWSFRTGFGPASDGIHIRRNRQRLSFIDKSNSSITLRWESLQRFRSAEQQIVYTIRYNDRETDIETNGAQAIEYILTNLTSNTLYKIFVVAKGLAPHSSIVNVRTTIGHPRNVYSKKSETIFDWAEVDRSGGNLDFFEILATSNATTERTVQVRGTRCTIATTECESDVTYFVRAVSVKVAADNSTASAVDRERRQRQQVTAICKEENNDIRREIEVTHASAEFLEGSWSKVYTYRCPTKPTLLLSFFLVVGIVAIVPIAFLGKTAFVRYKKMKRIAVIFPVGLEDIENSHDDHAGESEEDDNEGLSEQPIYARHDEVRATASFENLSESTSDACYDRREYSAEWRHSKSNQYIQLNDLKAEDLIAEKFSLLKKEAKGLSETVGRSATYYISFQDALEVSSRLSKTSNYVTLNDLSIVSGKRYQYVKLSDLDRTRQPKLVPIFDIRNC